MATTETCVTMQTGEFPYGSPAPNEVALASGAVRALMHYQLAIEAGQTVPPSNAGPHDVAETQAIAQSRLTRAIIGSMRCTDQPVGNRTIHARLDDPEATGACNDQAEAQQLYESRQIDIIRYAEMLPYGVQHEDVLQAALLYAADTASEAWQYREVQDIAASRGYDGLLVLLTVTVPDSPATIEEYARTS